MTFSAGEIRACGNNLTMRLFGDAFHLLDQGNPSVARRKLLKVLTEHLNERKNFQMYPPETSVVS
jgi:hypothetical protein